MAEDELAGLERHESCYSTEDGGLGVSGSGVLAIYHMQTIPSWLSRLGASKGWIRTRARRTKTPASPLPPPLKKKKKKKRQAASASELGRPTYKKASLIRSPISVYSTSLAAVMRNPGTYHRSIGIVASASALLLLAGTISLMARSLDHL